jgi:hypothetical protein
VLAPPFVDKNNSQGERFLVVSLRQMTTVRGQEADVKRSLHHERLATGRTPLQYQKASSALAVKEYIQRPAPK